jgi:DNA-binding transcriptional MocR family regulator
MCDIMPPKLAMQDPNIQPVWLSELQSGVGPRYLQIAELLERAIAKGMLRPGDRLPSQRQLAEFLNVDLTTVTRGLNEARRRQLVAARGPLGTFVSAPKVELTPWVDLSMNIPPPPADLDFESRLREGMSQVLVRSDINLLMTYHMGGGSKADRSAGVRWLKPILGRLDPERVVVCPGAQAAVAALILSSTRPGDVILTEPLVYPGLPLVAAQLGRRVEAVAVDKAGMRPDALEEACRAHEARLLYLNPTLQNPTAHTMPEKRRLDIATTASRCNLRIIEDDPYWLFADSAPAPLAHLMPQHVYYVSTLSKCLSPGLRTAFLLLPETQSQDGFLTALRSFLLMSAPLMTALVTQWVHDGSAAQLLTGVLAESRARQHLASKTLSGAKNIGEARGIHLWHTLPSHWAAQDLAAAARAEGLGVAPSSAFFAGPIPPNAIRISLGGCSERTKLEHALQKLSAMLARKPSDHRDIMV